uniref:Uncharacterized protein n=1 Tax=Arundo donax TaxID=35708 RepID=A0A0A9PP75_ARUDO
MRARAKDWSVS